MAELTAAILAGGQGTRLRSAVNDRPKTLAEVDGRPFVTYLLDQLESANIRRVIFCTGYRGAQIQEALGEAYRGMELLYSQEDEPLGTGGALENALPFFDSDPVLVMNGDSYLDFNLVEFIKRFEENPSAWQVTVPSPIGGSSWINAGIYLLTREILMQIPRGRFVSLENEIFPGLISQGRLFAQPSAGRFIDIGTPESYERAQTFFEGVFK